MPYVVSSGSLVCVKHDQGTCVTCRSLIHLRIPFVVCHCVVDQDLGTESENFKAGERCRPKNIFNLGGGA